MPPPQGTPNPLEGPGDYTFTRAVHSDTYAAIDPTKVDHTGHAVFITGASRGIGRAIAISFAQAGASYIAITGRTPPSSLVPVLEAAAGAAGRTRPAVLALGVEVTSEETVQHAAACVEQAFGRLDIVINNAGVLSAPARIADDDPREWWRAFDVNLRGPYLVTRAFIPLLLKSRDGLGTVVIVSSVGAHLTRAAMSSYQISKLAVLRLAEHVCSEYGNQGIVAYCVHPGNVPTDMVSGLGGLPDDLKHVFTETPELPGDAIVYLTAEKRKWLGGRYINCTWDMPEVLAKKDEIVEGDQLKVKLVT